MTGLKALTPDRLRMAYAHGYFPMPEPGSGEILWYKPDPRAIIPLNEFHTSKSLRRSMRQRQFVFTVDQAFSAVMAGCAERSETWIDDQICEAYEKLFDEGDAHSIEVWQNENLVGGLYGVALGGAFFAESKFHRTNDASKAALHHLVELMNSAGFSLLEVQFITEHLKSLGARTISGVEYQERLAQALLQSPSLPRTGVHELFSGLRNGTSSRESCCQIDGNAAYITENWRGR